MLYSFDDGAAPELHDLQYFEIFCNRGIYHQDWSAVTRLGAVRAFGCSCDDGMRHTPLLLWRRRS
jgi:hypothetical protein